MRDGEYVTNVNRVGGSQSGRPLKTSPNLGRLSLERIRSGDALRLLVRTLWAGPEPFEESSMRYSWSSWGTPSVVRRIHLKIPHLQPQHDPPSDSYLRAASLWFSEQYRTVDGAISGESSLVRIDRDPFVEVSFVRLEESHASRRIWSSGMVLVFDRLGRIIAVVSKRPPIRHIRDELHEGTRWTTLLHEPAQVPVTEEALASFKLASASPEIYWYPRLGPKGWKLHNAIGFVMNGGAPVNEPAFQLWDVETGELLARRRLTADSRLIVDTTCWPSDISAIDIDQKCNNVTGIHCNSDQYCFLGFCFDDCNDNSQCQEMSGSENWFCASQGMCYYGGHFNIADKMEFSDATLTLFDNLSGGISPLVPPELVGIQLAADDLQNVSDFYEQVLMRNSVDNHGSQLIFRISHRKECKNISFDPSPTSCPPANWWLDLARHANAVVADGAAVMVAPPSLNVLFSGSVDAVAENRRMMLFGHEFAHHLIWSVVVGLKSHSEMKLFDYLGESLAEMFGVLTAYRQKGASYYDNYILPPSVAWKTPFPNGRWFYGVAPSIGVPSIRDFRRHRLDSVPGDEALIPPGAELCSSDGDCLDSQICWGAYGCGPWSGCNPKYCMHAPGYPQFDFDLHQNDFVWTRFARLLARGTDGLQDDFWKEGESLTGDIDPAVSTDPERVPVGEDVGVEVAGIGVENASRLCSTALHLLQNGSELLDWVEMLRVAGDQYKNPENLELSLQICGFAGESIAIKRAASAVPPAHFAQDFYDKRSSLPRSVWCWRDPDTLAVKVRVSGHATAVVEATGTGPPSIQGVDDGLFLAWIDENGVANLLRIRNDGLPVEIEELNFLPYKLEPSDSIELMGFADSLLVLFREPELGTLHLAAKALVSDDYTQKGDWLTFVQSPQPHSTQLGGEQGWQVCPSAVVANGVVEAGTKEPFVYLGGGWTDSNGAPRIRMLCLSYQPAEIEAAQVLSSYEIPIHAGSYSSVGVVGLAAVRSAHGLLLEEYPYGQGGDLFLRLAWADPVTSEVYQTAIRSWDTADGPSASGQRLPVRTGLYADSGVRFLKGLSVNSAEQGLIFSNPWGVFSSPLAGRY